MTILVAYAHTDEGAEALRHGTRLSHATDQPLIVFDLDTPSTADDGTIASGSLPEDVDLDGRPVHWIGPNHQSPDPAEDLLDAAERLEAQAIVVGIRRRSRVGKLILGSRAQKIIIGANAPVISVKAGHHEH